MCGYAVISTKSGVIYFGGYDQQSGNRQVAEFIDMKWTLLGYLASPKGFYRAIKFANKIYVFSGRYIFNLLILENKL